MTVNEGNNIQRIIAVQINVDGAVGMTLVVIRVVAWCPRTLNSFRKKPFWSCFRKKSSCLKLAVSSGEDTPELFPKETFRKFVGVSDEEASIVLNGDSKYAQSLDSSKKKNQEKKSTFSEAILTDSLKWPEHILHCL